MATKKVNTKPTNKANKQKVNNLMQYGRNVGRSLVYTSVDAIKEMNPVLQAFAEENAELTKEVFAAVKDYKGTIEKGKHIVAENQYVKLFNTARKNFFEDLKTGNWYNREREDTLINKAGGFDDEEDDWEWSGIDDDSFLDDDESDLEFNDTEILTNEINSVGEAATNAVVRATASSADYIAKANNAGMKSLMEQNKKHFAEVNLNLSAVNSNIANLCQLGEPVTTHINESHRFYSDILNTTEQINKTLTEILELQKTNSVQKKEENKDEYKDYRYIHDANGVFNVNKYFNMVKSNIKRKMSTLDSTMGVDFGGVNVMETMVSKPIASLISLGLTEMVPKEIKKLTEQLNSTIGDLTAAKFMHLNRKANDDEIPIFRYLQDIFGLNISKGYDLNTSEYEKGKVDFDGIARKSIVEVIPTYLSKILASVSGEEEMRYNYEKGKFETVSNIRKNKKYDDDYYFNNAVSEFRSQGLKYVDRLHMSAYDRKEFENYFDKFLRYMYNNAEDYQYRDRGIDGSKYGISDEAMRVINYIYQSNEKTSRSTLNTKLNRDILYNISRERADKEYRNKSGDNIYTNLINGSLMYTSDKKYASEEYYKKMKSTILSDEDGNDIFFYLRSYYKDLGLLSDIIETWHYSGITTKSKKNSKGNKNNYIPQRIEYRSIPRTVNWNLEEHNNEKRREESFETNLEWKYKKNGTDYEYIQRDENGNYKDFNPDEASDVQKLKYEVDEILNKSKSAKKSVFKKLSEAKDLNEKYKTILEGIDELTKKPATLLASILERADKRVYDAIYNEKTGDDEKSFIELMKDRLNETFDSVLNKADDTWQKMKDGINGFMKKSFGFDFGDAKEFVIKSIMGEKDSNGDRSGGIIGDFYRDTKSTLGDMWKTNISEPFNTWVNDVDTTPKETKSKDIPNKARGGRVTKTGVIAVTGGEYIIPAPGDKDEQLRKENIEKQKFLNSIRDRRDQFKFLGNFTKGGPEDKTIDENGNIKGVEGAGQVEPVENPGNVFVVRLSDIIDNKEVFNTIENSDKFTKSGRGRYGTTYKVKEDDVYNDMNLLQLFAGDNSIKYSVDGKKKSADEAIATSLRNFKDGVVETTKKVANYAGGDQVDEKTKDKINTVLEEAGIYSPNVAAGGLVGAGFSLLTGMVGGPLLGAAVGSAITLTSKSEKIQDMLFGKVDEKGNRSKGLFSQEHAEFIQNKVPDIVKYGMGGSLIGTVIGGPLGTIGGLTIGSALGYAKNTEDLKNAFFGKGAIGEGLKEKLTKALPKMGAGALLGSIFSPLPLGIVGNAMLGAAIGFASNADKFQDVLFGKKDINNERHGGIAGALKKHFLDPIVTFGKEYIEGTKNFFQNTVFKPIEDLMEPIKARVRDRKNRLGMRLKKKASKWAKKAGWNALGAVGRGLKRVGGRVTRPIASGISKLGMGLGVKLPVYLASGIPWLAGHAFGGAVNIVNEHLRNKDAHYGYNNYDDIDTLISRTHGEKYLDINADKQDQYSDSLTSSEPLYAKLRDMDPQKREKLLTQAANMQIGIDDKTGIALDTYKSLYKKTFKDLKSQGFSWSEEERLRRAMFEAKDEAEFKKILGEINPSLYSNTPGVGETSSELGEKLIEKYNKVQNERSANAEISNKASEMRSNFAKALGLREDQLNMDLLGNFAVSAKGHTDKIFGKSDTEFYKNKFFSYNSGVGGRDGAFYKTDYGKRIIEKINNDDPLTEEEEKILNKYIKGNYHHLNDKDAGYNDDIKNYFAAVKSRSDNGWNNGWVPFDEKGEKTGTEIKNEEIHKMGLNIGKMEKTSDESRDYLSKILNENMKLANTVLEISHGLSGNDYLLNMIRENNKSKADEIAAKSEKEWDEETQSYKKIEKEEKEEETTESDTDNVVNPISNPQGLPTTDSFKSQILSKSLRKNTHAWDGTQEVVWKKNRKTGNYEWLPIQNKAFGGETVPGLAVVSKGEQIIEPDKGEDTASKVKSIIEDNYEKTAFSMTDRGGIIRLRKDKNGEVVTDLRDRDTRKAIYEAGEESRLLKEISNKLDRVALDGGGTSSGSGDDNGNDDEDNNEKPSLLTSIKNLVKKVGSIGGLLSGATTALAGSLPQISKGFNYVVVPLLATGLFDEPAAEADPEEYQEYTDANGNEFGNSLSDRAKNYMTKRITHNIADWSKLNLPDRITEKVSDVVKKYQDKKFNTKKEKANKYIKEYEKLKDTYNIADDASDTVRKINNIDDAIKYMNQLENGADTVDNITDGAKLVTKASKKAQKQVKNVQRYEKLMNFGSNAEAKFLEFITKVKTGFVKFGNFLMDRFPKIKQIFGKFMDKIYKPLKEAFEKASESVLGRALKTVAKVLSIIFIIADFNNGYDNAGTFWGVTDDKVTDNQRMISGIVNCLNETFGFSLFISTTKILEYLLSAIEYIDPDLCKDIRNDQRESKSIVDKYNEESRENLTVSNFNAKFYNRKNIGDRILASMNNGWTKNKNMVSYAIKTLKGEDTSAEETEFAVLEYQKASDSLADMAGYYSDTLEKFGLKMYVKIFNGYRGLFSKQEIVSMNMKVSSITTRLANGETDQAKKLIKEFNTKYPIKKEPTEYLTIQGNKYKYEIPKNVDELEYLNVTAHGIKVNEDGTWSISKGNSVNLNTIYHSTVESTRNRNTKTGFSYEHDHPNSGGVDGYLHMTRRNQELRDMGYNGSGSGLDNIQKRNGTFVSQLDSKFANKKFTDNTTLGENGCGPAVASMVVNSVKNKSVGLDKAAKFAVKGKYATDEGTESSYFKDFLGGFGIKTNYIENTGKHKLQEIKNKIASGEQVILLGNDKKNKSKKNSPFGSNDHYVLANGIDKNGNVIISDPESDKPMKYDSKILNNVRLGIETNSLERASGSGLYRGGASQSMADANLGIWSAPSEAELNDAIAKNSSSDSPFRGRANVFLKAGEESGLDPRYILAHAAVESGWGNQSKYVSRNNYFGIGAFDSNPDNAYSFSDGSSSNDGLATGIIEGSKWIAKHYYNSQYKQTTLNKMRFNNGVHQYATDPDWASKIASIMEKMPSNSKITYDATPNDAMPAIGDISTSSGTSSSANNTSGSTTSVDGLSSGASSITDPSDTIGSAFQNAIETTFRSVFGSAFDAIKGLLGFGSLLNNDDENADSTVNGTGDTVDSSQLTGGAEDIVTYARSKIGKLSYSQADRNIDQGSGDCSSFAQWAVKKATGIDPGGDSEAIYTNPNGIDVSTGGLDESQLQPGDLLLYTRNKSGRTDGVGHVEIYEGNGKRIGHGGPDTGAKESDITRDSDRFLKAKRFALFEDPSMKTTGDYMVQDGYSQMSDARVAAQAPKENDETSGNATTTKTTADYNTQDGYSQAFGSGSGIKRSTLYMGESSYRGGGTENNTVASTTNIQNNTKSNASQFASSKSDISLEDMIKKKSTNNLASVVKALSAAIDQLSSISSNTEYNAKIYELLLKYLVQIASNTSGSGSVNNISTNSNPSQTSSQTLKELSNYLNLIATK